MRTDEKTRQQVIDLYRIGKTYDEIKKATGIGSNRTIAKILAKTGEIGKRLKKKYTIEIDEDLIEFADTLDLQKVVNRYLRIKLKNKEFFKKYAEPAKENNKKRRIAISRVVSEEQTTGKEKTPYSQTEGGFQGYKKADSESEGGYFEYIVSYVDARGYAMYACKMFSDSSLIEKLARENLKHLPSPIQEQTTKIVARNCNSEKSFGCK